MGENNGLQKHVKSFYFAANTLRYACRSQFNRVKIVYFVNYRKSMTCLPISE